MMLDSMAGNVQDLACKLARRPLGFSAREV
jgi:hypothetical protein